MILRGEKEKGSYLEVGWKTRTKRGEEEKEPSRRTGKQEVQEGLGKVGGRESRQSKESRDSRESK